MQERHLYQCDEQRARSGNIDIEDYEVSFKTWEYEEDGVVDVQSDYLDERHTIFVIKATSEEHAEQLVEEHINEVSGFYCCDAEDARDGDIQIEVFLPGLVESLFRGAIYDADDGVFDERTHFFDNRPHFVIVAASMEHAEELMEEYLHEEDG